MNPGDHVELETWVRYRNENDYTNHVAVLMLSQLLGSTFAGTGGFEGSSIAQAATSFETALGNGGFDGDGSDETRPFAYLNYILFNDYQEMVDAGWQQVPVEAGFDPGEEGLPDQHRRVAFEEPIEVTETGYIYVWVSNESENVRVWPACRSFSAGRFDDLTISHSETILVQATDYGVWGDVLREQKTDEKVYRYGYQGQFAEKDEETGWNHFELREYDPVIGRTITTDPARQFHSPYMWVGNNPIIGTDPTGGVSPIYDMDGNFLGTDDQGLQGEAIFMHASQFTQGMSHASALEAGFTFSQFSFFDINLEASAAVFNHQNGLSSRPDWDGFVTIDEGVSWALAHPGALQNPTADNSLYINSALLDFGDVSTSSFAQLNTTTPVNLFSTANTYNSASNERLRATVYALGRVNMQLIHRVNRQVIIVNDNTGATDYDWNRGGGFVRDNFIRAERARTGINDSHGFKAYYYGVGTLRK